MFGASPPLLERRTEIIWAALSALIFALFFWVASPNTVVSTQGRVAIWEDIQAASHEAELDPHFVYAICMAESSMRPRADSGYARGLMQLSRVAWREVSQRSYREAYNPKANVEVGVAYLDHLKDFLQQHRAFSYANLAAAYRYGPYALKDADFDLSRLPKPTNTIYIKLFAGDTDPVAIPVLP